MRTILLTLCLTLVALSGCGLFAASRRGSAPSEDVHHLRVGMRADALRDAIGAPDSVRSEVDGSERWTYVYGRDERLGRSSLVVHVRDGEVRTWEERLPE